MCQSATKTYFHESHPTKQHDSGNTVGKQAIQRKREECVSDLRSEGVGMSDDGMSPIKGTISLSSAE